MYLLGFLQCKETVEQYFPAVWAQFLQVLVRIELLI